jgi:hypothetical protein
MMVLIGINSNTVYFEAPTRCEIHRWLNKTYVRQKQINKGNPFFLPEPMMIVRDTDED